jgi:hypothetical protein
VPGGGSLSRVSAHDGAWVVSGWEAGELVTGQPDAHRPNDVLRAGIAFHAAIAHLPRPAFLDLRGDASPPALALLEPVLSARRPVDLAVQVVHGDLLGNVLFADDLPPAIIDWRPPSWAAVVAVVDALCWYDAASELINHWAHLPGWKQILTRALIFRIIAHDVALGPYGWTPDQLGGYQPVVALVATHVTRRKAERLVVPIAVNALRVGYARCSTDRQDVDIQIISSPHSAWCATARQRR